MSMRGRKLKPRGWKVGLVLCAMLYLTSPVVHAATQEEFFKSMQQSVEGGGGESSSEAARVLMLLVAGGALVGLVLVLGRQRTRKVASAVQGVHHPRKLMREIARAARVSSGEVRQLKVLAEQEACASPITLLLCPSLLVKGIQTEGKADRKVLLQLAKKMGLIRRK